jgi:hypothetical protein
MSLGVTRLGEDGKEDATTIGALRPGERIIVRHNELVPADAVLREGEGYIDYSFVSGENTPVHRHSGELVYAGARQTGGRIVLEVVKTVSQSYITQLWNNNEGAARKNRERSYIHPWSRYFTLALFTVAAGAGICAMGLALPPGILPFQQSDFIIWGITAAISVYCYCTCLPYKKARDVITTMESEFADSLFVLGRRMSEGRPPEEGFAYTARMVSGTAIGKAYARAAFNISCLRSTLRDAVLDPGFGAFADVYSDRIRATISMLVETSAMSGEVAGGSIIRIADHLKELQGIEEEIKKMLFTMTSMLKMTCVVFAPFIAGITLALSGAVADIVTNTMADMRGLPESARPYFPMVPQFTAPSVSAADFTLIVGVYVILLVIILLRFVDGIEHGDDVQDFMYSVGRTLPVAVAVFSVTTAISGTVF